jgi:hypothetical protein
VIAAGPATLANRARNAMREPERLARWAPAREACWHLLDRHVPPGARVLVAGAGHGDDLPLARLAQRCSELVLADLDPSAVRRARARLPRPARRTVRAHRCELTSGAADDAVMRALAGRPPRVPVVADGPIAGGGFDVVVGDLLYSQLIYPALVDRRVPEARQRRVLEAIGPALTDGVVGRLHASAVAGGCVVHLHDAAGWWAGHPQPHAIDAVLAGAGTSAGADAGAELLAGCRGPLGSEPRDSLRRLGAVPIDGGLWEWPFAAGTRYVVQATVVRA